MAQGFENQKFIALGFQRLRLLAVGLENQRLKALGFQSQRQTALSTQVTGLILWALKASDLVWPTLSLWPRPSALNLWRFSRAFPAARVYVPFIWQFAVFYLPPSQLSSESFPCSTFTVIRSQSPTLLWNSSVASSLLS